LSDEPKITQRHLDIPVSHGHLEAILREAEAPFAAVVICHPHPMGGGTMHNNVVYRLARALGDAGAAVLRFNFRGVGRSTGQFDHGDGEQEDALAATDHLVDLYPNTELWMAGFSFGARVGLGVGNDDVRVKKLLGVGLALKMFDYSFLATSKKPKAFIQGSEDEYGARSDIEAAAATFAEPKQLTVVEGASHLFPKHLDALEQAAASSISFLRSQAPSS
jgi:alpha/beta superfamily hydrolase